MYYELLSCFISVFFSTSISLGAKKNLLSPHKLQQFLSFGYFWAQNSVSQQSWALYSGCSYITHRRQLQSSCVHRKASHFRQNTSKRLRELLIISKITFTSNVLKYLSARPWRTLHLGHIPNVVLILCNHGRWTVKQKRRRGDLEGVSLFKRCWKSSIYITWGKGMKGVRTKPNG